jgi:hypothetical protein
MSFQSTRLNITGRVPGMSGQVEIAAWIFPPKQDIPKGVLFRLGGSFSKAYYHLVIPNYPANAYSFASFMVQHGWLVVTTDLLGTGESTLLEENLLTVETIARANDALVRLINDRLKTGNLHPDIAPFTLPPVLIGLGHGVAGMLAIAQQAYHDSYDALIVLGWSNIQKNRFTLFSQEDRNALRSFLHATDVPLEVILADEALATRLPLGILLDKELPQRIPELAAEIDIPIFVGCGVNDAFDLKEEAQTFSPLAEITTFQLPGSGHCHNFSKMRKMLWQSLDTWGQHVVDESIEIPNSSSFACPS